MILVKSSNHQITIYDIIIIIYIKLGKMSQRIMSCEKCGQKIMSHGSSSIKHICKRCETRENTRYKNYTEKIPRTNCTACGIVFANKHNYEFCFKCAQLRENRVGKVTVTMSDTFGSDSIFEGPTNRPTPRPFSKPLLNSIESDIQIQK